MKWTNKLIQTIKIGFPIVLLVLAGIELSEIVRNTNFHLLRIEIINMNDFLILFLFIAALLAVSPMFLYDIILLSAINIQRSLKTTIKQSFIVNTVSNFIGFGGIAGLMLRSYYYAAYQKDKIEFFKNITSVTLFSLTGMSVLAWVVLIGFRDFPLFSEVPLSILIVTVMGIYLPIMIGFHLFQQKKGKGSLINWTTGTKLVLSSLLEWSAIFIIIWLITYSLNIPIEMSRLLPVFIVATCAGNLSMIPGGMGSFDVVFLWGMESYGIQDEKILVLLIFYRLSYYVFPFLLSAVLFVIDYCSKKRQSVREKFS
ncbi:lysylphosphatidylglycerol synthase domain-containing protein [Lederbergia sp. NSJ-179]|uniref:lysylphosphatidylglycerol synthase domain-containing protein n=1 Tax=Lederbergia sp. NSJ-179 TaxID=2931402 RepID=UPI001FD28BF9|nr:lysylphosphatidylglycerol synthase domain-containing protein [Lederbergia sp. NSJ-179]MCJ7840112.1 lysylphosphatidylglycerol synthase domain-containing protein [Lederbergia sp. NSJ-179]